MSSNLMPGNKGTSTDEAMRKNARPLHLPAIAKNGDIDKPFHEWPTSPVNKTSMKPGTFEDDQKLPPVRPQRGIKARINYRKRKVSTVTIKDYFDNNRKNLEKYIMEFVTVEELQQWLIRKTTCNNMCSNDENNEVGNKEKFLNTIKSFDNVKDEESAIKEIAISVGTALSAGAFGVYKLFPDDPAVFQYYVIDNQNTLLQTEAEYTENVLEVAKTGAILRLSTDIDRSSTNTLKHVMYQPILNESGQTTYIVELWRSDSFDEAEEKLCSNFITWNSLALHYCNLYWAKNQEYDMYGFLLESVKSIFEDIESLDHVMKRVLEFVQKLVKADRASLFLVDNKKSELVPPLFDIKYEPCHLRANGEIQEIRLPLKRGIAGHVAVTGKNLNIADAYSDPRFNSEVDELTGYKTKNILCMPIKVQGNVMGVVQMINKRNNSTFDQKDEMAFERFSTFFGLALQHAKLYHDILKQKLKYEVALEVLSYHNTCKDREVDEINKDIETFNINMDNFYLDPYMFDEIQKCKAAITMFDDLFDLSNFNRLSVIRFILTVKINYRNVPYHNFDHGWSVAHAMYVMLKNDTENRFDSKMRQALFVASICHDLDHRGYTNKYLNETASPLATMYSTSPLEHHHFNITVKILHQSGHDIFSHMAHDEYRDILKDIEHCILATDLAAFFPNMKKMKSILEVDKVQLFNWQDPKNCKLAMAISMTAADLSASTKPWDIQIKTVQVIFEEFYEQGDKERAAGKIPVPMMDRYKPEEQATSQVGFLEEICVPCYEILRQILPNTNPMYEMVGKNLETWRSIKTNKNLSNVKENPALNDDLQTSAAQNDLEQKSNVINEIKVPNDQSYNVTLIENKINSTLRKIDSFEDLSDKIKFKDKVGKIIKLLPMESSTDDEGVVTPTHSRHTTQKPY
ncbi:probable 3',5'-cyclic phosphodiesterase pde-5 isoform X2 [Pieris napi]|uniref:probable 3',5'-cyclic phosphodiesterase pde-5 isoform X2 n=1 Tax=Pieris napi TaxID=78633 RepID=UPI001FB9F44E|nr:probable 3',5'-cyclic phosphodiesterase pde-5 isoform X2 [Pieris napi]